MADPITISKVALKVATVLSDEEKRKKLIITIIVVVITVVFLVLLVPIYLITAPLDAVKDIISGDISLEYIWELRKTINPDENIESTSALTSGTTIFNGGKLAMPISVDAKITSLFGYRSLRGKSNLHTGLDFGVPTGTEVMAVADGIITTAIEKTTSYGHHIIINHGDISTLYAHGSTLLVKQGDTVKQGQIIMRSGNTRE